MERIMLVERLYRKPDGGLVLVQRVGSVYVREPGMIPFKDCVHYGEMPESVKKAFDGAMPFCFGQ